jgi:hypothetical protein
MKQDVKFDFPDKTIVFKDVDLPDANTPLPPTNATIHILGDEIGYGTRQRRFIALCGVSWSAVESTGEHKYFHPSETHWHKHVNCTRCKELFHD